MALHAFHPASPYVTVDFNEFAAPRRFRATAEIPEGPDRCRVVVGMGSTRAAAYLNLAQRLRDEIAKGE